MSMLLVLGPPILTICGPAVTILCKENGININHMEVVGSRLSANTSWMNRCQAYAAIGIQAIITNSALVYFINRLLLLLLTQPLPSGSIYGLSSNYLLAVAKYHQ